MATRMFENKEHASFYQKYRFSPPQEIQEMIFSYVHEKLSEPYELAVDVGCGTGQSTIMLASLFKKVLGTDISEAQIEEANKTHKLPNTTFRALPAEEVPVDDASVDLITACTAIHWFDIAKFLKEVDRILKPRGCLAFYTYTPHLEVHYKDRSEQMCKVISEVIDHLTKYQHQKVNIVESGYKGVFEDIPYPDKIRKENVKVKIAMPLSHLLGLVQSFSTFQKYRENEPEKAKEYIKTTEQRFLEIMGVSSRDTEVDVWFTFVIVLASKPK